MLILGTFSFTATGWSNVKLVGALAPGHLTLGPFSPDSRRRVVLLNYIVMFPLQELPLEQKSLHTHNFYCWGINFASTHTSVTQLKIVEELI